MKKIFGEKGILSGKKVLAATLVIVLLSGITLYSVAAGHEWKSQGNVEAVRSDGTKTVIFDKGDLDYLDGRIDAIEADVSTGKENLANALNPLGTNPSLSTPLSGTSTFNELMEAINHSQAIPDKTIGESVSIATEDYELASTVTGQTINSDTKISAATAANLSLGTSAWVDGSLVIGTGADNKNYYNFAYTQGIADGLSKANVKYIYHEHSGDSTTGTGCYTVAEYHKHTDSCYKTVQTGTRKCGTWNCYSNDGSTQHFRCSGCGATATQHADTSSSGWGMGDHMVPTYSKQLNCTKGNEIIGYQLGCGKTEESIESAIITF